MQLINDLSVKLKRYENQINASIQRVIQSGWLVLGPEVEEFETSFAEYHSRDFCVGVANGTDALELALRAIDVTANSRVATVANAGAYATSALNSIGATACFMEVDEHTQCVTRESVETALSSGIDAVIVTHLFGRVVPEIAQIAAVCRKHGVPLLEDCAQAHGASIDGRLAGCFGDIASFSFYPTKNLGALGDGGAVLTHDKIFADAMLQLRQYGWTGKYEIGRTGGRNSRLDAIQAALLTDFLPHLSAWNDERLTIAQRYDTEIDHPQIIKPPLTLDPGGKPFVAHLYVVRTSARDSLRAHLRQHDIQSDVHYPIPDHKQETMLPLTSKVSLPITEMLSKTVVTLPCYPGMSQQQLTHVIESVNSWVA